MTKVFQLFNGDLHWETPYKSIEETKGKYAPDVIFVEAPDYVFESWSYDENAEGDARFIKPEAPEGWVYDDRSGTFYNPEELEKQKEQQREDLIVGLIRAKYSANDEYKILREKFAYSEDETVHARFVEYNEFVLKCKAKGNEMWGEIYG